MLDSPVHSLSALLPEESERGILRLQHAAEILGFIVQVSGVLQQIAEAYGTSLVEGVLSHQLKQFVIDGNKCVLNKPTPEHRAEDGEFEENEVYGIDILVSASPATTSCVLWSSIIRCKTANWQHFHLQPSQSRYMSANVSAETIAPKRPRNLLQCA